MTILDKLHRIPPFMCRYLARTDNGRRGLTNAEIADRAKLSIDTVKDISYARSFDNYTVRVAVSFALACGVNHAAAERQMEMVYRFIRGERKLSHTKRATGNSRRMYERIESIIIEEAQRRSSQA